MSDISRRDLLRKSGILAGSAALGLPMAGGFAAGQPRATKRLTVVAAGAHPDDPESSCGGTLARYAELGHTVIVVYLTRGEAGIEGKSHEEAARIRTAEAKRACAILNVRPVFAGQIDGSTEVTNSHYDHFRKIIEDASPDILFTHWPIDSHRDHRACSLLAFDAWLKAGKKYPLYYFETKTGFQSSDFNPTHLVDITQTEARKRKAYFEHKSQAPEVNYPYHDQIDRFRGLQAGVKFAEAFNRHLQSMDNSLPMAL